jgi:hypothetical protein
MHLDSPHLNKFEKEFHMQIHTDNIPLSASDLIMIEYLMCVSLLRENLNQSNAASTDRYQYLASRLSNGPQTREQLIAALLVYDAINSVGCQCATSRESWPEENFLTAIILSSGTRILPATIDPLAPPPVNKHTTHIYSKYYPLLY